MHLYTQPTRRWDERQPDICTTRYPASCSSGATNNYPPESGANRRCQPWEVVAQEKWRARHIEDDIPRGLQLVSISQRAVAAALLPTPAWWRSNLGIGATWDRCRVLGGYAGWKGVGRQSPPAHTFRSNHLEWGGFRSVEAPRLSNQSYTSPLWLLGVAQKSIPNQAL